MRSVVCDGKRQADIVRIVIVNEGDGWIINMKRGKKIAKTMEERNQKAENTGNAGKKLP